MPFFESPEVGSTNATTVSFDNMIRTCFDGSKI
jgi:hypothetical protein